MPLRSHDPRRLLPPAMEERLIGWSIRAGGLALLACVAAAWASLLTWSQSDPSLTHAADGAATNALGAPGAIFADVLLNTLGFAGVFLLLAPMFWGLELDARRARLHQPQEDQPLSARRAAARRRLRGAAAVGRLAVRAQLRRHRRRLGLQASTATGLRSRRRRERHRRSPACYFLAGFAAAGLQRRSGARRPQPSHRRAAGACRVAAARCVPEWLGQYFARCRRGVRAGRTAARAGAANPQRPRYATDDIPRYGIAPEPVPAGLPPPFERPNHVVQAGVCAGDRRPQRDSAAAATPCTTIPGGRDADFDDSTDRGKPRHRPPLRARQRRAPRRDRRRKSSRCRCAERAPARRQPKAKRAQQAVRRPRADRGGGAYRPPSLEPAARARRLPSRGPAFTQTVLRGTARLLEDVLADFGVKGEVRDIKPGPVVTLFELEPARGTKAIARHRARRRHRPLDERHLGARRRRPRPQRHRHRAAEQRRDTVGLREHHRKPDAFQLADAVLPLALGSRSAASRSSPTSRACRICSSPAPRARASRSASMR